MVIIKWFKPIMPLQRYISRIWAFENPSGIPYDDAKLVAPNGCMKLIVPYKKKVASHIGKMVTAYSPLSCIIVGQQTNPVRIESEAGGGTIGIEFKTSGAGYFFKDRLDLFTNQVSSIQEAWESSGIRMQDQLSNIESIEAKVAFLQKYLIGRFKENRTNQVVDYAIKKIVTSSGFVSISDLSEDIGYSRQHVTRLFKERVGVSPKEIARIVRFQQFYRRINSKAEFNFDDLYDYYYDQSHFIKEFQNFVGYFPHEYSKIKNDFGKIFYGNDKNVPFLQ
jgi:AraC-like DNA-binding protein